MGWDLVILNKTKKVAISAGKTNEGVFIESAEILSKFMDTCFDRGSGLGEIEDKTPKDLTIRDMAIVVGVCDDFNRFTAAIENARPCALFLYNHWKSEGDELLFEVDPLLDGYVDL